MNKKKNIIMKIEERDFEVSIPTADGEAIAELVPIRIPMEWDEELQEWLMTEAGLKQVEETKARYMGLMLPGEIKALREKLRLTQKEISDVLQIGEKTWSPWETGRMRPSRSMNLLLRALDDGKITVDYLKALAQPRVSWRADAHYMSFNLDTLFDQASAVSGSTGHAAAEVEEQLEEAVAA
ncbi:MAG: hypothetical protein EA353_06250 [Puniceicoccaceae bacterium]|nr:MAG: hypothetical protein EA353_06250 [Puniceicoccaceae bacterium]